MNATKKKDPDMLLAVDIDGLCSMLSCGHATAKKIGELAGAKIVLGRRVLYSVDKVQTYINLIAE